MNMTMHRLRSTKRQTAVSYLQKHLVCEPNEAWISVLSKVCSHYFLAFPQLVHLEKHLHKICIG